MANDTSEQSRNKPRKRRGDAFMAEKSINKRRGPSPSPADSFFTPTTPPCAEPPNPHNAKLRISIDYGTKTLAAAYAIVLPGQPCQPSDVHMVDFGQDYYVPQQVAWDDKGWFYWGFNVEEAVKRKAIRVDQIVELWKLLLYKAHATSELAHTGRVAGGALPGYHGEDWRVAQDDVEYASRLLRRGANRDRLVVLHNTSSC